MAVEQILILSKGQRRLMRSLEQREKPGVARVTCAACGGILKNLPKLRARKRAHEVQRYDVESWLNVQSFSLKTRANYLRDLGILFNFAVARRWMAENPCAFIEKPSELDREVSVLKPEEASKLVAACPDAFLPGVCVKLFAGLRTSELLSLEPEFPAARFSECSEAVRNGFIQFVLMIVVKCRCSRH